MEDKRELAAVGRTIGVLRLITLIKACELEGKGPRRRGTSALSILKRQLRTRGNRETVLTYARKVLAEVGSW